ncbi:MAG: 2-hydroxyacid dehydrogenase [Humibacillus sp.]|nr:2-hydroxyacid dehydrogenase [Humibacillus sp.]MDN5777016.1 2-hydroxyacid dehydrogenase [Humibacillus sp.]
MTPSLPVVISVPDPSYAAPLGDIDGVEVVVWDLSSPHPRAAEVRLVVTPYLNSVSLPDLAPQVPALEVIQLQSAGYDHYIANVPPDVTLCNAAGVHDASTAELALTLTLASLRDLPEFVTAQASSHWSATTIRPALADKRVLVLGYGHVGREIVSRLVPFEVEVTVVASRARAGDDLVPQVHGIDELPELAAAADVLVVIVPLNDATRGLVDAELLARLPDAALIVNVARGPVVVTDDLLAECASGRLHAALDVTDPEPLPEDHPAWTTPGVLVTPHVGGATTAMRPRALALIRRQVEALRDGEPLVNVVNG